MGENVIKQFAARHPAGFSVRQRPGHLLFHNAVPELDGVALLSDLLETMRFRPLSK
jgi:hypothetical protein